MEEVMEFKPMRRIFVFSLALRVFHWANALSITVLIATGLIMANPPVIQQGTEASFGYWFGTVRFIHFVAAYVMTIGFAFRIYLMFNGNKYESWRNFIPVNKRYLTELWEVIKIDIFLKPNKTHFVIGHNALAGFSYFVLFVCMLLMILTGFSLYSEMSVSAFPKLFTWVGALLGGDVMLRIVHHTATWLFVIFIIIHVYLVFYHDYVEGRGEISSMGGGWKFFKEECYEQSKIEGEDVDC